MTRFSDYWCSPDGENQKASIVQALKSGGKMPKLPFAGEMVLQQDEDDQIFNRLEDVRGIEIAGEQFEGCDLSFLNLSFSKFVNCCFLNVDMFSSRLHKARFVGCEFASSRLEGVYGLDAEFNNCSLNKVNLGSSFLIGLRLDSTSLTDSEIRSARLINPHLREATIKNCELSRSLISPTESFSKEIRKNKGNLICEHVKWLSPDGAPIPDPLRRSRLLSFLGR